MQEVGRVQTGNALFWGVCVAVQHKLTEARKRWRGMTVCMCVTTRWQDKEYTRAEGLLGSPFTAQPCSINLLCLQKGPKV